MNKLSKISGLLCLLLISCSMLMAQNGDKQKMSREQLVEKQAKHIAVELSLAFDDTVYKQFIQTYCAYQKDIWALGPRIPELTDNMSDDEVEKILQARFERGMKIIDIREKYYHKFSKFLTAKQINKMYEMERAMMHRLADNHKGSKKK